MPKRFTETLKWDDPWFRALSPDAKLLWFWLVDKCDSAGIITPDFALCEFQTGIKRAIEKMPEIETRIAEIAEGKYIICRFIEFQHGKLSRDCKAHNPAWQSLEKHEMLDECDEIKGYRKGIHTLSKGYPYPTGIGKGKEIGKGKGKEEEKENEILPFDSADFATFWANWKHHLKEKKKPLKPTSEKMQLAKLAGMGERKAIQSLKNSMENGWQGLFEPQMVDVQITVTPEMNCLTEKINALRPDWKMPAQWSATELNALNIAESQLKELTDNDWLDLAAYLSRNLSKDKDYWQPRGRLKFVETFSDVCGSLQRWRNKGNGNKQSTGENPYY